MGFKITTEITILLIVIILILAGCHTQTIETHQEQRNETENELKQITNKSIEEKEFYNSSSVNLTIPKHKTIASRGNNEVRSIPKEKYLGVFEATAYINPKGNKTASGSDTVPYKTIAVDPRIIPLGTKLKIKIMDTGDTYIVTANDTGGVVKRKIVDICVDTYSNAIKWGRRKVEIWIIEE